jgi:serine O-acetyltransferase
VRERIVTGRVHTLSRVKCVDCVISRFARVCGVGDAERSQRTVELLKEDWAAHQQRPWMSPGFYAIAAHRLGHAVEKMPGPIRRPVRALALVVPVLTGIELPRSARLGRRVRFGHQPGVVIADNAVIGDDCLIRQNVTIGAAVEGGLAPRLGNRVRVGAGAVLIGDIAIGDDVIIGPNAVVTDDVPVGGTVLSPVSRILRSPDAPVARSVPTHSKRAEGGPATAAEVIAVLSGSFERLGPLDANTSLLASGLIDSLDLPLLLELIEDRFSLVLPVEDVTAEKLDTPEQIAALINGA